MEQHPIPRQITTFEFKLIGFMTLKQFLYLLVFIPSGFVIFKLFPIPLLNLFLAAIVMGAGVAFAFLPINDRPLDVWIRNLYKRLVSPTQYIYRKNNQPLYFLNDLYFLSDPHKILTHIESREKLSAYLQKTKPVQKVDKKKQNIQTLLNKPTAQLHPKTQIPTVKPPVMATPRVVQPAQTARTVQSPVQKPAQTQPPAPPVVSVPVQHPYLTGVIKNNKHFPLPGILVYIKNPTGTPVRLLKSNPHGVFATYNPLPSGEYKFELKDPNQNYFFDTMKINVNGVGTEPLEFYSKEIL